MWVTDFGKSTLIDRYLLPGEKFQDMFMRVARNFSRHGITSTFTTEPTPPTFLTRNLLLFYATVAAFGTFAVIVPAPATGSATTTQGTHFFIGLVGKTVRFMFILAVSRMIHEKFRQVSTQLRGCCRLQVISHPVVHLFSESRSHCWTRCVREAPHWR